MTEEQLRAELLAILADLRADKRERATRLHSTSIKQAAEQLAWPAYVESRELREAREMLAESSQILENELAIDDLRERVTRLEAKASG